MDDCVSCSQGELVRPAWAARRELLARQRLLQAFQGAISIPLCSDLNNDPFAVFGYCVAGVVVRELTEAEDAEEGLHALLGAHELHQALPPAEGIAARRRF